MNHDVIIVGAGPTGLSLAKLLGDAGMQVLILERSASTHIEQPSFDGREIALTHQSCETLRTLGSWSFIPEQAVTPLMDAKILNGAFPFALHVGPLAHSAIRKPLGYLVSNHWIRKASHLAVAQHPNISIEYEKIIQSIKPCSQHIEVRLQHDEVVCAKLLVAADSRFSDCRRIMGIPVDMHDYGKMMMVCQMSHTRPHHHSAWEWFDYPHTLALLPMKEYQSSIVLTLTGKEMDNMLRLSEKDFSDAITQRFKSRLGQMQLVSTRHVYPLVGTYAQRFVDQRFALIGDAAVGMHPVTAHGFNFGLKSVKSLGDALVTAYRRNQDIACEAILLKYQKQHRKETKPLFMATHLIAKLYTDNRLPARILRNGAIFTGQYLPPVRERMVRFLA